MHPLEVPWLRAQIHEKAINRFNEEARKANPDFDSVVEELTQGLPPGLKERHKRTIREQLSNLAFAAKTVRKTLEAYGHNPDELYHDLTGLELHVEELVPSTFSLHFILNPKSFATAGGENKFAGFAGHTYSLQTADNARAIIQKVGVRPRYLQGLVTHGTTAGDDRQRIFLHESDHVISMLLNAHLLGRVQTGAQEIEGRLSTLDSRAEGVKSNKLRVPDTPYYEEVYTHLGEPRSGKMLYARFGSLMAGFYGLTADRRESKTARDLDSLIFRLKNSIQTRLMNMGPTRRMILEDDERRIWSSLDENRRVKSIVRKGLGGRLSRKKALGTSGVIEMLKIAKRERQKMAYKSQVKFTGQLKEILRIQKEYGLSDFFVQALARTNSPAEVIKILKYNLKRKR